MEIKKHENMFYIGETVDKIKAKIVYADVDSSTIVVNTTWVSKELEGQGIAKKLLNTLVDWARNNDKKVMATCSYAVYQFEKHEEYSDIYLKSDQEA